MLSPRHSTPVVDRFQKVVMGNFSDPGNFVMMFFRVPLSPLGEHPIAGPSDLFDPVFTLGILRVVVDAILGQNGRYKRQGPLEYLALPPPDKKGNLKGEWNCT